MARGLPVVASAVGGVPTAIAHEERGLLFPSGDVEALGAALRRMRDDRALRERCQRQGNAFAREQTLELSTRSMIETVGRRWPFLRFEAAP